MATDNEQNAAAAETSAVTKKQTKMPASALFGTTLDGRYFIEKELGHGGVGAVYLARDRKLHDKPVVIKVLLERSVRDPWVVQKFQQEKEALARVDHHGVVGIIDAGELPDGKPYIVIQFIDGVTLRSVMKPEGMSLERAAELVKQIGRALDAAHDKGIFHRDLKPENIMLQTLGAGEEQVKIIDFGIAKIKNSLVAPSTVTGETAGTIAYMAPEQLSNKPISAATDIYALGTIAYEMVTGRRPFNPETEFELLEMQRAGVRVKPVDLRPSLPEEAQQVILRTLTFEPRDRQQSARDFGEALARSLVNEADTLKPRRKDSVEIPPTQLSVEMNSPTRQPTEPPAKTLVARVEPVDRRTFEKLAFRATDQAVGARPDRKWLKVAISTVLLVGLGAGLYLAVSKRAFFFGKPTNKDDETGNASIARSLVYSLTVQKFHNGRAYDQSFETSGQEIFENGWKFKMNVSSPQEGYLYLLNEGPAASGATTYNMLFPEPKTNSGSAHVDADKKLQTAWMRFDEHQGTERFWIVWSASPIKELENVTGAVNAEQKGEISNDDQVKAVHDFLDKHSSTKPEVARDAAGEKTTINGKGDVLVSNVELRHH